MGIGARGQFHFMPCVALDNKLTSQMILNVQRCPSERVKDGFISLAELFAELRNVVLLFLL